MAPERDSLPRRSVPDRAADAYRQSQRDHRPTWVQLGGVVYYKTNLIPQGNEPRVTLDPARAVSADMIEQGAMALRDGWAESLAPDVLRAMATAVLRAASAPDAQEADSVAS